MMYHVDEQFQAKLDDFNTSQGGNIKIDVCWNSKKGRWQVFAVPNVQRGSGAKMMVNFPDGSGRRGVHVFTLADHNSKGEDIGFHQLDDRLFKYLRWADTFRSRTVFEDTIEKPEAKRKAAEDKDLKDAIHTSRQYWRKMDDLTISMNPATKVDGDRRWRHR